LTEFNKQLDQFHFFKINEGVYTFDENFIFKIIENIFSLISKKEINFNKFSINEIFIDDLISIDEKYSEIIKNFLEVEKNNTLLYIADLIQYKNTEENLENTMQIDQDYDSFYKLNLNKIKSFCLKNIFLEKNRSLKLSEFLSLFRYSLRLILPNELLEIENQNNFKYLEEESCEDNIFEYYKEYDFRFMKNQAYIYFLKTQREPLIQYFYYFLLL